MESTTRERILQETWKLLEQRRGQGVRMSDIASAAGVSRQAVYLHFSSRADLLVATTQYGDQVKGLRDRLRRWREATLGIDLLREYVDFWGRYIPEIYGVAKALLETRETDEAVAVAWNERMDAVRSGCRVTIEALVREGALAPEWTCEDAIDAFWTMLSIRNWELLTLECGWSVDQYVTRMTTLAERSFVRA